ncbi:hypothetical protein ACIQK5_12840 [Streptomyces virginiae]|uniref:hypothetical protein n=1 Tax=Streptomyces TaxID=1883 RepID=UPI00136E8B9A|nr:hypothetical protein [Streptomyces sp. SID1046]MYV75256.1 hypothetical protein [Streptomyces sp. SID1046]
MSNGLPMGRDDACTHFAGHPDKHSWALFDPVSAYIDEHLPEALLHAVTPFLCAASRAGCQGEGRHERG